MVMMKQLAVLPSRSPVDVLDSVQNPISVLHDRSWYPYRNRYKKFFPHQLFRFGHRSTRLSRLQKYLDSEHPGTCRLRRQTLVLHRSVVEGNGLLPVLRSSMRRHHHHQPAVTPRAILGFAAFPTLLNVAKGKNFHSCWWWIETNIAARRPRHVPLLLESILSPPESHAHRHRLFWPVTKSSLPCRRERHWHHPGRQGATWYRDLRHLPFFQPVEYQLRFQTMFGCGRVQ